ncbi:hypothetical protein ACFQ10_36515 [Streptomyces indonesiensis]
MENRTVEGLPRSPFSPSSEPVAEAYSGSGRKASSSRGAVAGANVKSSSTGAEGEAEEEAAAESSVSTSEAGAEAS